MSPSEHAAAIVRHYLRNLTLRAGLKWTDANDADMQTLASLLDQVEAAPELDSIPPFVACLQPTDPPQLDTRVTQVFDRPQDADPNFRAWRGRKAVEDDAEVRRLVRR
jgi:hypothetical protein